MKQRKVRKHFAVLLMAGMVAGTVLYGCGKDNKDAGTDDKKQESVKQEETSDTKEPASEEQGKRVAATGMSVSMNDLNDCTVEASFDNDAIQEVAQANGSMTITMTVYAYELFDAVDISKLTQGDTLVIDGKSLKVESLKNEDGLLLVNGGMEKDGVNLVAGDGGTYYETLSDTIDVIHNYREIATVTLPAAENFEFVDQADLDKGEQTYSVQDVLEKKDSVDFSCNENNCAVRIENGKIANVTKYYRP